jgi:hypothetical protein
MIRTRKPVTRFSVTRAPLGALLLLGFVACAGPDRVSSPGSDNALEPAPSFAAGRFSGIPFGTTAQPISVFGPTYTGGLINPVYPESLLSYLAAIKAAKGRVVLSLPGGPGGYTNADGTFNLSKWKTRVSRYTVVNFNSYINDSTIIGNYIIDQPNCSTCWGGVSIPADTVEAMAQYSKSLWPKMATIARADPTWLATYAGQYTYLDAGWAQYVMRKGDANTYLSDNIAAARSKGLRVIVGLNVLKGGLNEASLTATQVKDFGSVMLSSSYPCAFLSWQYNTAYFARSDIKSAMSLLSKKAARQVPSYCWRAPATP